MTDQERQITITAADLGQTIRIDIGDSGPGIPPDLVDIIFDPFYTTKEVGKGLGLGLSISYNIIKDFGGQLTASAEQSSGSRFTILLQKADG